MAQLTPNDQDESDDGSDITAPSGAPPADDEVKADGPVGGRADIEARRAATKARMEAGKGDAPKAKATSDDPTGAKARKAAAKDAAPKGKATSDDPTGAKARKAAATTTTNKVARPSKRTGGVDPKAAARAATRSGNPKKAAAAAAESTRYTAPIPRSQIESPPWVAGLMFGLLGLGMVVIFLTYVAWGGRPAALGVGLGCILAGILTGTRVR